MADIQRFTDLFTLLDGNKNGFVAKNDVEAVMKIFKAGGNFPEAQLADVKVAIENLYLHIEGVVKSSGGADNRVTLAEWLATADKSFVGKPFADAPAWWKTSIASIFTAADTNNNGVINENEFVTIITGMIPSVPASLAKAAFAVVQGKLDKPAFQKTVWAWFSSTEAMPQDAILTLAVSTYGN